MKKVLTILLPSIVVFAHSSVHITQSTLQKISLFVLVPQLQVKTESTEIGSFSSLYFTDADISAEIGSPQLPVIREFVEIPFDAEVDVRINVLKSELVYPDKRVIPLQPLIPKSGPKPEFTLNSDVYEQNKFTPSVRARINMIGEIRGHRVCLLEIYPVVYNVKQNIIEYAREMNIELNLTGANLQKTQKMRDIFYSKPYDMMLSNFIKNYDVYALSPPPDLPVGYLIIVPDEWVSNIMPLAQWRTRKGYKVFIRTLSQIGSGSSSAVRNDILQAYNTWPIRPTYVLLVGDVDKIGYFNGVGAGNPPTDLNYSMMTTPDYLPDIDVSRASVANSAQLDSLVQKITKYEKNEWISGTDWLNKAYFIASIDGANHQVTEGTHRYCMAAMRRYGIICDSLFLFYNSGTPITTAINGGRSWVTYSGHGNTDRWDDPPGDFTCADVRLLTNTDKVPFVGTFACLAGNFTSSSVPECFSETWIRTGYRGAISHLASTVTSYWTEDDTLQRRVFDYTLDSNFYWTMGMVNKAKLRFFEQMGNTSTTRRYFEMYNMMGDGAIDIYSDVPSAISVTYPSVIPLGTYPIPVTVTKNSTPVSNALVCAMAKNDTSVVMSAYTDVNGQVVLNITTTSPDSIYITVTGHNLAPHLGGLITLASSGPYLMYLRHLISDPSPGGNNDGIINPGEAVEMRVWLKNLGNSQANNVRAWLRTADANITITDSFKSFGNINAGDSAFLLDGFQFSVAASCTNAYNLRFALTMKDALDSTWQSNIIIPVGHCILEYISAVVYDTVPSGNNNRMLEPGERGDLVVTLRNLGLGHGYNVSGILMSTDSRLIIIDSIGTFDTIYAETTGNNNSNRFKLYAMSTIPRDTQILCTLKITATNYNVKQTFFIPIGVLRTYDPIPDNSNPTRYFAYDNCDIMYTECPVYNWVEIKNLGTNMYFTGEDQTIQLTLPVGFGPFKFYGQRYNQISVCINGWIAAGATTENGYINTNIPNTQLPNGMICLNWDDLYPELSQNVWYWFNNHRLIVEWDSVRYSVGATTMRDKFQVIIYDTTFLTPTGDNEIMVQYMTANNYISNTMGIENQSGTIGIQYLYNTLYNQGASVITAQSAIKYTTRTPLVAVTDDVITQNRVNNRLLFINHPNPFSNYTIIRYAIPQTSCVRIEIYDITGRLIKTLKNTRENTGVYAVIWNGKDDNDQHVANGIYFCRLKTDNNSLIKKMNLIR